MRVPGPGWRAAAALGLLLAVCAAGLGAEALLVPGIALLGLGAGSAGWVALAARTTRLRREADRSTVIEGEPLAVRVAARSVVPWPGGVLREVHDLPLPAGARRVAAATELRLPRRGRHELPAAAAVVRDPLGLAECTVRGGAGTHVLVLPRIEPVRWHGGGAGEDALGAGRRRGGAEIEFDGLRAHRPGTPAARIYWPALARGAGLMERALVPEGDGRPLVVLDATGGAAAEDLDAAVRAAASLAHALARAGGCSVLLPGARRAVALAPDLRGWARLHASLALVSGEEGPPAIGQAAAGTALVLVAARPPARLPRAARRVLVTPTAAGPPPAAGREAFTVAGCTGYALGADRRRRAVA